MKPKTHKRMRLYGKRKARMPKPRLYEKHDKGFSLRAIEEADGRFVVVKRLRERLAQLVEDAGIETIQQEWLAARAVFIVGFLESVEVDAFEGKQIDWGQYIQAVNGLNGVLTKLGMDKKLKRETLTLDEYCKHNGSRAKDRHRA